MRRLLAPLLVVALSVGLLSGVPTTASAAPPTSTWTGAAGGDTAAVDLTATGLSLSGARLATSQGTSGSQLSPRSTARSANLGASVAGLGIAVASNQETAGPAAGTSSSSPNLSASAAGVVSIGALQTADTASWAGDNACLTTGPLASASTQTAGVGLTPLGLQLLSTGVSTTTGTTELAATGSSSVNGVGYGVRSTSTGTIAGVSVLGVGIGVSGPSTLRTTANAGGTSYAYNPGTVTVTNGGTTRTLTVGSSDTITLNLAGALTATIGIKANALPTPTTTATSISAGVPVVTVNVTVASVTGTVLSSTIDLLPLRSSASVPVGGIDCPAPVPAAPVVTTPPDGSRTNDTTPTYSGTGIAGATLNLVVDGTRTAGVTTVGNDGTWTFTPTAALPPGGHTVSATQTRFGAESTVSNTNRFTVDVTAPAAPVLARPADGAVIDDRTPTYTGTAEAGSSVTVYEGTTALGTGTANASGAFSIVSSQLAAGSHTVRARATDEAGNTSVDSNANTFLVDVTAPAAPVIVQPVNGSTTTDTTPTISGTAEANASVQVLVDGTSVGTTTANLAGLWTLDATTLGQGAHTATAIATDPAGNASPTSNAVRFTVDSVAPDAPVITQPANGSSTNDTTPTIVGTAEAGSRVVVSVDGVPLGAVVADGGGRFEVTPVAPLVDGPHAATAVATDAIGNASATSATVRFTVDTAVPVGPVLVSPADGAVIADRTPTYVGAAEPLSTVTVYEGTTVLGTGRATAAGTFSITSASLAEGSHTVIARSVDAAGNVSVDSNANTFTVDATAPAAPVVQTPVDGSTTNDPTPTVSGTAEPNASVQVSVDGTVVGTTAADGSGRWSLDAPVLLSGAHTATARATDAAGNRSVVSNTVRFTVDLVAPAAPVITSPAQGAVTDDATPAITGSAEPGSSVEVLVDGIGVGTVTAGTSGRFSLTSTTPLTDDLHTATATATDAATNRSLASVPVVFQVDTTAPPAPVIVVPVNGSATADTTPPISGTADPGCAVRVFVDGASIGTTTADPVGVFEITPSSPLAAGLHVARATATDAAGNLSLPSDAVTFTVDATAPAAPVITAPVDGSSTNNPSPVIGGTAEAGTTVEVLVDGLPVGTAVAGPGGGFQVTPAVPLLPGQHTATALATDAAGNVSPTSAPVTFTVDLVAPVPPVLLTPVDGFTTADTTPTYTGLAEPGSAVTIVEGAVVVGSGQADGAGTFTITSVPLAQGSHTVSVRSADPAGNTSSSLTATTFTIDTAAPAAPVVLVPVDGTLTTDTTPTISGLSEPGASVQVLVDGTNVGTTTADLVGAWSLDSTPLTEGAHRADARATDAAGNRSVLSNTVRFTVDSVAPAIPVISAPRDGSTVSDPTPVVSGTAEPFATVRVSIDGVPVGIDVAAPSGAFSVTPTVPLGDGPHVAVAVATDPAGNVSVVSVPVTFVVDQTATAPVLLTPLEGSATTDRTPTYTGTADPLASVTVYEGATALGTGQADEAGLFSIVSARLDEGPHTVVAVATDVGGAVSADSNALTFTVDATAPAAPVILVPADQSSTDDLTPTISGTAEPGATVRVQVDGLPVGLATAGPGGAWTLDSTALLPGAHRATAVATDAAGSSSPASDPVRFTIDVVAPLPPVIVDPRTGSTVADTTPTISGTAEAGATVVVSVDGTPVGTVVADGDGNFSATPTAPLTEALHTATAVATDAAGNGSLISLPVVFTVDTTVPAAPVVVTPADGSFVPTTTPTISGTAEAGALVEVFVDGDRIGTVPADGTGAWTVLALPLSQGGHTTYAVAVDAAGNTSVRSNTNRFTVDSVAPTLPVIDEPADGTSVDNANPPVSGTAEPGATVTVLIDGAVIGTDVADGAGRFTVIPTTPLAETTHVATAVATDPAGNPSLPSVPVTFTVDLTAPGTPVITEPADGSSVADTTPTIRGTAEPGATVEVFVDGASIGTDVAATGTFSVTPTTPLGDGPHVVTAVATDAAGNPSRTSVPVTFTVDVTDPAAPVVVSPADGSTVRTTTPTVSGTAEPNVSVSVSVDGVLVGTVPANGAGAWSVVTPLLTQGGHTTYAVAVDAAGNTSVRSNTNRFTVDTVAPLLPVITRPVDGSSVTDTTPTISGTAEPGATVVVSVDGTPVGTDVAAGDGTFSVTPTTPLSEAQHTATAVATDAAGNGSSPSVPVTFTVDASAPAAPVVVTPADGSFVPTTTPTISGTAEANASVQVSVDGNRVATVLADGTGAWSVVALPLSQGGHTTYAVAVDSAGNTSVRSNTNRFTVDSVAPAAPVVTAPEDGSTVGDPTPTITGTAAPGSTVVVSVDGTPVGTDVADGNGDFSVTPTTPLGDGPHVVTAVATDPAGNPSLPSVPVGFVVDTTAPAAPVILLPLDGTTTRDTTPTVSGTAEPGATVEVFVDGVSIGTDVAPTGTFSVTPTTPLGDGPHVVTAVATDPTGNPSPASTPVTVTVDATAPAAPVILVPADNSSTRDATPTISGTAEPNAIVEVLVDGESVGTALTGGDGAWTLESTLLGQGRHTATARATDAVGNRSNASDPVRFTVDSVAPAAPVVTAPEEGSTVGDPTPTITGTAAPGSTVVVSVDGTPVGTDVADGNGDFSVTPTTPLGDGPHVVTAVATDPAGNPSLPSVPAGFVVDTTAPAAPVVVTPANGSSTRDTTPTLSGTAEPSSTVRVSVDGRSIGTTPADGTGAWSIDASTLGQGSHTVYATASDAAGNVSGQSGTNTFTVDSTAPAAPRVTTPANGSTTRDATPTISGTAEANASVEVTVDDVVVATVRANGAGAWTYDSAALADGPHTTSAVAVDAAGNRSPVSNQVRFTVDTVAPAAPQITSPGQGSTTTDPTPAISGTAEPGSTVVVSVDGTVVGTDVADANGDFSVTPTTPLPDGPHSATAVATDPAGNPSPASDPVDFTVDANAPAAPVVLVPANGSSTRDTTPTISGTAEPNATVEVFVDGRSIGSVPADGDGAWTIDAPELTQGQHRVTARATDAADNEGPSSAPVTFTVDGVAPAAPVITVPLAGSTTGDTTPTISGTAEAGASVEVFVDGVSVGTATADGDGRFAVTPTVPLGEGPHTATAVATDAADNVSPTSAPDAFTIDATAPAVPVVTTPADGSTTTDASPTLAGTAEPGATVEVFVDGESIGTVTATAGGAWTIESPILGLGRHTVSATATDEAGNVSTESNTNAFTVVAGTSPAPVITTPTEGADVDGPDVEVCGTGTAGSTIVLSRVVDDEDEVLGTATVEDDGTWCVDTELPDGAVTVRAVEVDADGQVSAAATRDFVVVSGGDGGGDNGGSGTGSSGSSSGSGNGSGTLASTGGPSLLVGLAALVLIGAGSGTVLVSRRRRRRG